MNLYKGHFLQVVPVRLYFHDNSELALITDASKLGCGAVFGVLP